ncbi:hypothetical protein D3C87_1706860 [compost metagenome]
METIQLERRVALYFFVGNIRPELAQRVHQDPDRALAHAGRAGHGFFLVGYREICRQKAHRRSRVDHVRHSVVGIEQAEHGLRVAGFGNVG